MKSLAFYTFVAFALLAIPALMTDSTMPMPFVQKARVRPFEVLPESEKSRLRLATATLDDEELYAYGMSHQFLHLMYVPSLDPGTFVDLDAIIEHLKQRARESEDPRDREGNLALAREVLNRKHQIAQDWRKILNEEKRK